MDKVRVGILGTGGIAKIHAWALTNVSNAHLIAVASRDLKRAEDFAKGRWTGSAYTDRRIRIGYEVEKYLSYDELLEDEDVDAVYVCLPNSLHYEYCLKALKKGKHCFVEKPMTVRSEKAWDLVEVSRERGLILQVGYMWRLNDNVIFAKRVFEEGLIGDLVKVKAFANHTFFYPKGWFLDPDLAGGGSLIDMGVHAIDTARFIMGDDFVSVYSHVSTSYIDAPVDDTDVLLLKTSGGVPVVIESGWAQVFSSKEEASVEVYGRKGFLSVFPTFVRYELAGRCGDFHPSLSDHDSLEMYKRQAMNFANAVLGLEKPACDGECGAEVVDIVEAAYRSSKIGDVVEITYKGDTP